MQANHTQSPVTQAYGSSVRIAAQQLLDAAFNRGLALLILLMLAPVLAMITVCIWWQDGAPITYGHYRVGKGGKLFKCLKFRSMVRDSAAKLEALLASSKAARAEWERDHKLADDPRITPIGKFLRKTSLDELPQLWNVVRGEMNLVGPRPITVPELAKYGHARLDYLSVSPGITGLWQVSGRSNLTYEERVRLDKEYVKTKTFGGDLMILLKTVSVVFAGEGAH